MPIRQFRPTSPGRRNASGYTFSEITKKRPEEKSTEILSIDPLEQTSHAKVLVAQPEYPGPTSMVVALDQLKQSLEKGDESEIREQLLGMASTNWPEMPAIDLRDDQVTELTPSAER